MESAGQEGRVRVVDGTRLEVFERHEPERMVVIEIRGLPSYLPAQRVLDIFAALVAAARHSVESSAAGLKPH
jgi:hypothetical protein